MLPAWVPLLVAGLVMVQAVLWTGILLGLRRRLTRLKATVEAELAAADEPALIGPQSGSYRGGTQGFPRAATTGVVTLTQRRLLFRGASGGPIDVPLTDVASVREDRWFRSAAQAGRMVLILQLHNGAEVGFMVAEPTAWRRTIESLAVPVPT